MSRMRSHLSYANVMASVALFIALGGTSYAVTQLPRNSVGGSQIRSGAVGRTELRAAAVRSRQIKNQSVAVGDMSLPARRSLRGQQGPTGPAGPPGPPAVTFGSVTRANGTFVRTRGVGGPNAAHNSGTGAYEVLFNTDVSACLTAATVAGVDGVQPENGEIVTTVNGSVVTVRTRNSSGDPTDLPFHLVVSC